MTERDAGAVHRDAASLAIGRSQVSWDGSALTLDLDERGSPIPYRLRGRVRVHPLALANRRFTLDAGGRHRWRPIAPGARVEAEFDRPSLRWSGRGYCDCNDGDVPLESDFCQWDWCRAPIGEETAILYNAERRDGSALSLALHADRQGRVEEVAPPPPATLPRSRWLLRRSTRADAGTRPRVVETLLDAPFYARSVIATRLLGQETRAMHESLDLDRFATLPVQLMLPFRAPRSFR
jgi:carotenoid 1,2-hydratase